jgi:hypothetical protein
MKLTTGRFALNVVALNLVALNPASAGPVSMRDGSSPIADRFSLCVSFRLKTRALQSIRACQYWFAAAISRSSRFASNDDRPYNQ